MFRNSACCRFYSLCCMLYNRQQSHGIPKIGYVPLYYVLNYVRYMYKDIYDEIIEIDYDVGRPGMSIKFNMDWRVYYSLDVNIDDLDDEMITINLIKYIANNTTFTIVGQPNFVRGDLSGRTVINPGQRFYGTLTIISNLRDTHTNMGHACFFRLCHTKTKLYAPLVYMLSYNNLHAVQKELIMDNFLTNQLNYIKKYKPYFPYVRSEDWCENRVKNYPVVYGAHLWIDIYGCPGNIQFVK